MDPDLTELQPMCESGSQEPSDEREQTLNKFKLDGVTDTGRVIGRGSFAVIVELEFHGLKCVGKRLHDQVYQDANLELGQQKILESFKDECELLERTKHPHIVQFLGIVYSQSDYPVPTLVMEYLPTTLDNFIKNHKNPTPEVSYIILEDVGLALCYLHGNDPKIIHRDLSANNVLLTNDLRAKISDLGVAKMLNLTPQTHQRLSTCPGTLAYMPPEALEHNPMYDTSIDNFSYGVIVLHVLSGECPNPSNATYLDIETKQLVARTELERRSTYVDKLKDHPLLGLIEKCLNMDAKMRPCANKILDAVRKEASHFPDRQCAKTQTMEKVGKLESQLAKVKMEKEQTQKDMQEKLDKERNSSKLKLKKQKDKYSQALQEKKQINTQMAECIGTLERELTQAETDEKKLKENLGKQTDRLLTQEQTLANRNQTICTRDEEISTLKSELEDRRENARLMGEMLRTKEKELCGIKQAISGKNKELQYKSEELGAKDDQLLGSNLQLKATNEQLILLREEVQLRERQLQKAQEMEEKQNKIRNLSFNIRQGADIPVAMSDAQCTVLGNKAYVGGGLTEDKTSQASQQVFEYNLPDNSWKTLPLCPTKWFGLGHLHNKLLLIGGLRTTQHKDDENLSRFSSSVYEFKADSGTWEKDVIPAMNKERYLHTVVSHANALAVCGGIVRGGRPTPSTEVFVDGVWHNAPDLPHPCTCAKAVVVNNTCHLMGGLYSFSPNVPYKCILTIPVSSLFSSYSSERESMTPSSWRQISPGDNHLIQYKMAPANLCGILLAIGGWDHDSQHEIDQIVAFSQEANIWVKVANLPVKRSSCVASSMTQNGEIIIVGGIDGEKQSASTWLMSMKL